MFDGTTFQLTQVFSGYPTAFAGGVYVAVGDYDGDGINDVIVGSGKGAPAAVYVYSGTTLSHLATFTPGVSQTGGLRVRAVPINGGEPGVVEQTTIVAEQVGGKQRFSFRMPDDRTVP